MTPENVTVGVIVEFQHQHAVWPGPFVETLTDVQPEPEPAAESATAATEGNAPSAQAAPQVPVEKLTPAQKLEAARRQARFEHSKHEQRYYARVLPVDAWDQLVHDGGQCLLGGNNGIAALRRREQSRTFCGKCPVDIHWFVPRSWLNHHSVWVAEPGEEELRFVLSCTAPNSEGATASSRTVVIRPPLDPATIHWVAVLAAVDHRAAVIVKGQEAFFVEVLQAHQNVLDTGSIEGRQSASLDDVRAVLSNFLGDA